MLETIHQGDADQGLVRVTQEALCRKSHGPEELIDQSYIVVEIQEDGGISDHAGDIRREEPCEQDRPAGPDIVQRVCDEESKDYGERYPDKSILDRIRKALQAPWIIEEDLEIVIEPHECVVPRVHEAIKQGHEYRKQHEYNHIDKHRKKRDIRESYL